MKPITKSFRKAIKLQKRKVSWKTRERNKNGKLEIDHGSKRLKICMERGSERTRKQNDFCFFHFAACFFIYRSVSRERQCSYARSVFVSVVWLAPFRQRRQKRFSFPSPRFDTLHDYVVKLPVFCRHSCGGSIQVSQRIFFSSDAAMWGHQITVHPCMHPFEVIFLNKFFTSHLAARASHWCLARHTAFLKAIILCY